MEEWTESAASTKGGTLNVLSPGMPSHHQRNQLAGQISRLVGKILNAGIEIGIPQILSAKTRIRAGIHVANVALAK
jgi:hypothetical protein